MCDLGGVRGTDQAPQLHVGGPGGAQERLSGASDKLNSDLKVNKAEEVRRQRGVVEGPVPMSAQRREGELGTFLELNVVHYGRSTE